MKNCCMCNQEIENNDFVYIENLKLYICKKCYKKTQYEGIDENKTNENMYLLELNMRKLGYTAFKDKGLILFYKSIFNHHIYCVSDKTQQDIMYRKDFGIVGCCWYVDFKPIEKTNDANDSKNFFATLEQLIKDKNELVELMEWKE